MRAFGTALFVMFLSACGSSSSPPMESTAKAAAPAPPAAAPVQAVEAAQPAPAATLPAGANAALTDPSKATATAPATYKAKFETTKGNFVIEVTKAWAPLGADRFYNLVKIGYYDDVAFFRVITGFMVQFGIHGVPAVNDAWRSARIQDDPVKETNARGMVTFATSGPNTRTTQVFVNFRDNRPLDPQGFAPFGKVIEGMDVVDSLHAGYGEGAPRGKGPSQSEMQKTGNSYLKASFPQLDWVKKATIVE
jgi:peptidyl-prolyl cis-trans isomerase A (cyclophilin A)